MATSTVTIQPYSDKNILVQGDYEEHSKAMKRFQARWNSRLKSGPGWLVPLEFESAIRTYFNLQEDDHVSPRYKPSTRKTVARTREPQEDHTEQEDDEQEDSSENPSPPPRSFVSRAPVSRVPVSRVPIQKSTKSELIDPESEDIVSLANKMRDMMHRLDRLENH